MNVHKDRLPSPCGRELLSMSFPSSRDAGLAAVGAVVGAVSEAGLSTVIDRQEFRLVIDEAVTNAMEHGNGWDPGKKVTVVISHSAGRLRIAIGDECGVQAETCPAATGELKERGRGCRLCAITATPRGTTG